MKNLKALFSLSKKLVYLFIFSFLIKYDLDILTIFMRFSPFFLHFFLYIFKHQFPSYFQDSIRRRFVSAELKSPSVLHLHLFLYSSLSRPRSLHPRAQFSAGSPWARCVCFWSCGCGWLQQGAMWSLALCALPLPLPPPGECWSSSAARWTETKPTEKHMSFIMHHHTRFNYIIRKASWDE